MMGEQSNQDYNNFFATASSKEKWKEIVIFSQKWSLISFFTQVGNKIRNFFNKTFFDTEFVVVIFQIIFITLAPIKFFNSFIFSQIKCKRRKSCLKTSSTFNLAIMNKNYFNTETHTNISTYLQIKTILISINCLYKQAICWISSLLYSLFHFNTQKMSKIVKVTF